MGKGAALLGLCPVRQGQGGGLCATCGPLRGVCKRGLGCETPRPHTSGARAIWRFLSPHPENRGYRKHSHPTAGPQRRSPPQQWSQPGNWTPCAWGQVPLPDRSAARYSVHVPRQTWAFPGVGKDLGPARPLPPRTSCFPGPGGRWPRFVCFESAGSVRPGPAGIKGQGGDQGGGREGGGGERFTMQGWRRGR